jgi:pumilio family protein 6
LISEIAIMSGTKRKVDSADDRKGKRTKTKTNAAPTAAGTKKKYLPPTFQKKGITIGARKMNRDKKLRKQAEKQKSVKKGQYNKKVEDEEEEEDENMNSDISSDESEVSMDDDINDNEPAEEEVKEEEEDQPENSSGDVDADKSMCISGRLLFSTDIY